MTHRNYKPKRVAVQFSNGSHGLGELMYTTIDGQYVVHLDGDSDISVWNTDNVEFLEDSIEEESYRLTAGLCA